MRWRPWLGYRHVHELRVDGATVGELLTYSDHVRARYYVATPDDSWRRTFRRRSDAKRWLLARAAGLAEVPRRKSFGTRYGSPQTGVVVTCPSGGMYVPRGWRFAGGYMNVDGEMVVHLGRNRRRR